MRFNRRAWFQRGSRGARLMIRRLALLAGSGGWLDRWCRLDKPFPIVRDRDARQEGIQDSIKWGIPLTKVAPISCGAADAAFLTAHA
jgi:hypothetical protein